MAKPVHQPTLSVPPRGESPARKRGGGRRSGEGALPPFPFTRPKEHGARQAAPAPRGDARTFLTHFVGSGLDDERYVIQRYLSRADGNIVPIDANGARPKGRRKPRA